MLPPRFVGVDLGQASDPTAIAILEADAQRYNFQCRHLERLELNRPYPEYVARVKALMSTPELRMATLIIDYTGVGRPVMDMFHQAGLYPVGITITAGERWSKVAHKPIFRVPKRDIATAGLALLQGQRLKISRQIPEAGVLVHEMLNFRIKITATGQDTYEAWREGDHDDLVLAVCCAAWYALNGPNVQVTPSVGGAIPIHAALSQDHHALGGTANLRTLPPPTPISARNFLALDKPIR